MDQSHSSGTGSRNSLVLEDENVGSLKSSSRLKVDVGLVDEVLGVSRNDGGGLVSSQDELLTGDEDEDLLEDDDVVSSLSGSDVEQDSLLGHDENDQDVGNSGRGETIDMTELERRLKYLPIVLKQNAELKTLWDGEKRIGETLMEELNAARSELEELRGVQEETNRWEDVYTFALQMIQQGSTTKDVIQLVNDRVPVLLDSVHSCNLFVDKGDETMSDECRFAMESGQPFEKENEIFFPIQSNLPDSSPERCAVLSLLLIQEEQDMLEFTEKNGSGLVDLLDMEVLTYIMKQIAIVLSHQFINDLKDDTLLSVEKTLKDCRDKLDATQQNLAQSREKVDRFLEALQEALKKFGNGKAGFKTFTGHLENTIRTCLGVDHVHIEFASEDSNNENEKNSGNNIRIPLDYIETNAALILSDSCTIEDRDVRLAHVLTKHIWALFDISQKLDHAKAEALQLAAQLKEHVQLYNEEKAKVESLTNLCKSWESLCNLLARLGHSDSKQDMETMIQHHELLFDAETTKIQLICVKDLSEFPDSVPVYVASTGKIHSGTIGDLQTFCVRVLKTDDEYGVLLVTRKNGQPYDTREKSILLAFAAFLEVKLKWVDEKREMVTKNQALGEMLEAKVEGAQASQAAVQNAHKKYDQLRQLVELFSDESLLSKARYGDDMDQFCTSVVNITETMLRMDGTKRRVTLYLLLEDDTKLQIFRADGATGQFLQLGVGAAGRVVSIGLSTMAEQSQIEESNLLTDMDDPNTSHMICAPIMSGGNVQVKSNKSALGGVAPGVHGCIQITNSTSVSFSKYDLEMLETIGIHVAMLLKALRSIRVLYRNSMKRDQFLNDLALFQKGLSQEILYKSGGTTIQGLQELIESNLVGYKFSSKGAKDAQLIKGGGAAEEKCQDTHKFLVEMLPVLYDYVELLQKSRVSEKELEQARTNSKHHGLQIEYLGKLVQAVSSMLQNCSTGVNPIENLSSNVSQLLDRNVHINLYNENTLPPRFKKVLEMSKVSITPAFIIIPIRTTAKKEQQVLVIEFEDRHGSEDSPWLVSVMDHFAQALGIGLLMYEHFKRTDAQRDSLESKCAEAETQHAIWKKHVHDNLKRNELAQQVIQEAFRYFQKSNNDLHTVVDLINKLLRENDMGTFTIIEDGGIAVDTAGSEDSLFMKGLQLNLSIILQYGNLFHETHQSLLESTKQISLIKKDLETTERCLELEQARLGNYYELISLTHQARNGEDLCQRASLLVARATGSFMANIIQLAPSSKTEFILEKNKRFPVPQWLRSVMSHEGTSAVFQTTGNDSISVEMANEFARNAFAGVCVIKNMLCVPLRLDPDQPIEGMVCVVNKAKFEDRDKVFCAHVAAYICGMFRLFAQLDDHKIKVSEYEGILKRNEQFLDETSNREKMFRRRRLFEQGLYDMLVDVSISDNGQRLILLQNLIRIRLGQLVESKRADFFLLNKGSDSLSDGTPNRMCRIGQGFVGVCAQNLDVVHVTNAQQDVRYYPVVDSIVDDNGHQRHPQGIFCKPVWIEDTKKLFVGVLVLYEPNEEILRDHYIMTKLDTSLGSLYKVAARMTHFAQKMATKDTHITDLNTKLLEHGARVEKMTKTMEAFQEEKRGFQNAFISLTTSMNGDDEREETDLSQDLLIQSGAKMVQLVADTFRVNLVKVFILLEQATPHSQHAIQCVELSSDNKGQQRMVRVGTTGIIRFLARNEDLDEKLLFVDRSDQHKLFDPNSIDGFAPNVSCMFMAIKDHQGKTLAIVSMGRPFEPFTMGEKRIAQSILSGLTLAYHVNASKQKLRTQLSKEIVRSKAIQSSEANLKERMSALSGKFEEVIQQTSGDRSIKLLWKRSISGMKPLAIQVNNGFPEIFRKVVQVEVVRLFVRGVQTRKRSGGWVSWDQDHEIPACNVVEYVGNTGQMVRGKNRITMPICEHCPDESEQKDVREVVGVIDLRHLNFDLGEAEMYDKIYPTLKNCINVLYSCLLCAQLSESYAFEVAKAASNEESHQSTQNDLEQELRDLRNRLNSLKDNLQGDFVQSLRNIIVISQEAIATSKGHSHAPSMTEFHQTIEQELTRYIGQPVRFVPSQHVLKEPVSSTSSHATDLVLPVCSKNRTIGFVRVISNQPSWELEKPRRVQLEHMLEVVGCIMDLLAQTTDGDDSIKSLHERFEAARAELEEVKKTNKELSASYHFESKLNQLCMLLGACQTEDEVRQTILENGAHCVVPENHKAVAELVILDADQKDRKFRKFESGLSGLVAHSGQFVGVTDLRNDVRFHSDFDSHLIDGVACNTFFCGPLLDKRKGTISGLVRVWGVGPTIEITRAHETRLRALCNVTCSTILVMRERDNSHMQYQDLNERTLMLQRELDNSMTIAENFHQRLKMEQELSDFALLHLSNPSLTREGLVEQLKLQMKTLFHAQSGGLIFVGRNCETMRTFVGESEVSIQVNKEGRLSLMPCMPEMVLDKDTRNNSNFSYHCVTSVALSRQPYKLHVSDFDQEGGMQFPFLDCQWVRSAIAVPCVGQQGSDTVLGILQIVNKREGDAIVDFSPMDMDLLHRLSHHVGACIERMMDQTKSMNAHHETQNRAAELQKRIDQLENIYAEKITVLQDKLTHLKSSRKHQQHEQLSSERNVDDKVDPKMLLERCSRLEEERERLQRSLENKEREVRRLSISKTTAQDLASRSEQEYQKLRHELAASKEKQALLEKNARELLETAKRAQNQAERKWDEKERALRDRFGRDIQHLQENLQRAIQSHAREKERWEAERKNLLQRLRDSGGESTSDDTFLPATATSLTLETPTMFSHDDSVTPGPGGDVNELWRVCDQMRFSQHKRAETIKKLINLERKEIERSGSIVSKSQSLEGIQTVPWTTVSRAARSYRKKKAEEEEEQI